MPARETPIVFSSSPSPRSRARLARKPLKAAADYVAAAMCGVVLAMTAPSGTKPVSTLRQSEIASFRAKAISMMRRILGD